MKKIAIVTDSTSDLSRDIANINNINIIPLNVIFENREYKDGVDITPEDFYKKLKYSKILPRTSQPSPEDFIKLYKSLLEKYTDIISIHISSGLSGTVNAAMIASKKLKGKVHVIDSKSISIGIGLLVAEAEKHIRNGLKVSEILELIKETRENTEMLFALNTLEYLKKGGRIGKVSSLLGSVFNIKPIIRVNEDGIYTPFSKTHTQKKAVLVIERGLEKLVNKRKPVNLAISHGLAFEAADKLKNDLENLFNIESSIFSQVGPVIGVHTGPGAIAAAVIYK
jgi:DegV family protein with EDD domain